MSWRPQWRQFVLELYLDVWRLKILKKILDFYKTMCYHIDTRKGEKSDLQSISQNDAEVCPLHSWL